MKQHATTTFDATGEARSLEEIAAALERTENFRVLRRLRPRQEFLGDIPGEKTKIGLLVDVETTGLDKRKDEVIELGILKFEYVPDGRVCRVLDTFAAFNEPSIPVPSEITDLTGITNEMLAGQKIDGAAVASFTIDAAVAIAHHAAFDKPFVTRSWPSFDHLPFACSATQVNWRNLGFESGKLVHILAGIGLFHDAHRAVDDCRALIEVLAYRPDGGAEPVLGKLLSAARKKTARIFAEQSPYEFKHRLKKRGYHWSDGTDGGRKCWYIDVDAALREAELRFLRTEIYGRDVEINVQELDAFTRFSD